MKRFNAYEYFEKVHSEHKIASNYHFCKLTSAQMMEDVLANARDKDAYLGIDDTNDGEKIRGQGSGYFDRRTYIIYVLKKFDSRPQNRMDLQHAALNECREIINDICTRLIKDRPRLENDTVYLDVSSMPYHEFPGYGLNGLTGMYMTITIDEPNDLCYDASKWNDTK